MCGILRVKGNLIDTDLNFGTSRQAINSVFILTPEDSVLFVTELRLIVSQEENLKKEQTLACPRIQTP